MTANSHATPASLEVPNLVKLAEHAIEAGAEGITVHPRPDQRHIRPHDVDDLAALIARYPNVEYGIEGNRGRAWRRPSSVPVPRRRRTRRDLA